MGKYEDVKVGDKFSYSKTVGLNKWGILYFARNFFIECEVIKVTKTQFTTESGRYRKSDGHCIGDGYSIYKAGDKVLGFGRGDLFVPDRCQQIELSDYDNDLQELRDAQYYDLARLNLTKIKSLEVAQEAASLIMQLKTIINNETTK